MDPFSRAARALHALILGVWAGAGLYEVLLLGPKVTQLTSAHDAYNLLVSVAHDRDMVSLLSTPVLLLTLLLGWLPIGAKIRGRLVGLVILTGVSLLQSRWFLPKRIELVEALGSRLEHVAAADPLRERIAIFDWLSQGATIAGVLLAAGLLLAALRRLAPMRPGSIQL